MHHEKEFSKRAFSYNEYNIIQKKVAKRLLSKIKNHPKKILDLGCGRGEIFKNIDWEIEKFIGVDISSNMCSLHPKPKKGAILNFDFEDEKLFPILKQHMPYDLVISSSSLQWARDIGKVFEEISKISKNIAFSIFTDKTFKTIYEISSIDSFLLSSEEILDKLLGYFEFEYEIKEYKLNFEDNLSKFRYIKRSGVSGGKRVLSYKETKNLIENYPLSYLEFEVIFITGKSLS